MSFKELLKKVESSKEFKAFKNEHENSFLFSAFLTLNPQFEPETQQLDYFIPEKHVETFTIDKEGKITHKKDEFKPKDEVTNINKDIKIDITDIKNIINKEIENQKLSAFKINKVILILQTAKKEQIWNIMCLFDALKMLRLHIDCMTGKITKNEQASIFDFVNISGKGKF